VRALDSLVALGTHPIMSDAQLSELIGQQVMDGQAGDSRSSRFRAFFTEAHYLAGQAVPPGAFDAASLI
jgi:hypothetical protein